MYYTLSFLTSLKNHDFNNTMMKPTQHAEFTKLYFTGNYTQKEIAHHIGVAESTVGAWARATQPLAYCRIRERLTMELERLTIDGGYKANKTQISDLIGELERIERLITKAQSITRNPKIK